MINASLSTPDAPVRPVDQRVDRIFAIDALAQLRAHDVAALKALCAEHGVKVIDGLLATATLRAGAVGRRVDAAKYMRLAKRKKIPESRILAGMSVTLTEARKLLGEEEIARVSTATDAPADSLIIAAIKDAPAVSLVEHLNFLASMDTAGARRRAGARAQARHAPGGPRASDGGGGGR